LYLSTKNSTLASDFTNFTSIVGTDESVDPIYSLLKSAAGLPTARTPASLSRSLPAPAAAITDVQLPVSDGPRSKNDVSGVSVSGGGGAQFHRSNSSSPHQSQSPHQRLQPQQQQQRKLPPVLHLPGMSIMLLYSGEFAVAILDSLVLSPRSRRQPQCTFCDCAVCINYSSLFCTAPRMSSLQYRKTDTFFVTSL